CRCMPLAIAPCQIRKIAEARALHRLITKGHIRQRSRTARRQLTKSILDIVRTNAEKFEKRSDLLEFAEGALAGSGGVLSFPAVRHERYPESRAGAADGAMNSNCSLVCHDVSFSPFRRFAISFLRCRCLPWPFHRAVTAPATW